MTHPLVDELLEALAYDAVGALDFPHGDMVAQQVESAVMGAGSVSGSQVLCDEVVRLAMFLDLKKGASHAATCLMEALGRARARLRQQHGSDVLEISHAHSSPVGPAGSPLMSPLERRTGSGVSLRRRMPSSRH